MRYEAVVLGRHGRVHYYYFERNARLFRGGMIITFKHAYILDRKNFILHMSIK